MYRQDFQQPDSEAVFQAAPGVQALQRVDARAELEVLADGDRTRLWRLRQEGSAKIRFPSLSSGPMEAILINTAGGLTGGDRIAWTIDAGEAARLTVTTQACEKVYRSVGGIASASARIAVGPGASVSWLPQETILYRDGALSRRLDAELAPGARLLACEAIIVGRAAHGERVETALLRDRWRIHVEGRLVHAEDLALGPSVMTQLALRAAADGGSAFATVLLVCNDAEALLEPVRMLAGEGGGASFWRVAGTGKLLARLVARDGYALRQRLVPILALLNGKAPVPKVWSI